MSAVRERLGQALFLRVAGPDGPRQRERIHGRPGPRWFEPGSPIVRVHGDAAMFIGGIRALLLQTLHPAAMTAVSEHSGFRGDMWGRLARTSTFLATTTFGAADDAQAAVDMVRSIHARITGTMDDGTPYAASDPHLLAWVHVAQVDSFLRAHQVYGAHPLDQAERDRYVEQTGEVARRLGVARPTDHGGRARRGAGELPPGAARHPAGPRGRRLPAVPPAAAVRCSGAVRRAGRGCDRVDAGVDADPAATPPGCPLAERTIVRVLGRYATGTIRWAMAPDRETAQALRVSAPTSEVPAPPRR